MVVWRGVRSFGGVGEGPRAGISWSGMVALLFEFGHLAGCGVPNAGVAVHLLLAALFAAVAGLQDEARTKFAESGFEGVLVEGGVEEGGYLHAEEAAGLPFAEVGPEGVVQEETFSEVGPGAARLVDGLVGRGKGESGAPRLGEGTNHLFEAEKVEVALLVDPEEGDADPAEGGEGLTERESPLGTQGVGREEDRTPYADLVGGCPERTGCLGLSSHDRSLGYTWGLPRAREVAFPGVYRHSGCGRDCEGFHRHP